MAYNVTAKSLYVKDEEEIISQNRLVVKEHLEYLKSRIAEKQFIDDVDYNQKWWKWYCQENRLDVATGKSLRGGSYLTDRYYILFRS